MTTGEPENLEPLKDDAPEGWWVTGYPWNDVGTPAHAAFLKAYQDRFGRHPGISSLMGYTTIKVLAAAFDKADSTATADVVAAMAELEVDMPWGRIRFRSQDNQSTIGSFIGRTKKGANGPEVVDSVYKQGDKYQPTDEMVASWRAGAN